MIFVIFYLIGRIGSFAYIPTSGIKTNVVHSQKLFLWVMVNFIIFENSFEKGEEASRHERK